MKLVTWNVNGLRACDQKGFSDWVGGFKPDVLCMQEIKAEPEQLSASLRDPSGYQPTWNPAEKKGYSGVATWSNRPGTVQVGMDIPEYDREGRVIFHQFDDFTLVNVYFPNGQRDLGRVPFKLAFYDALLKQLQDRRAAGEQLIVCGDWNTSHQPIDLANPGPNSKCTGFLPEEREWMTRLLSQHRIVDVYRHLRPDTTEECYTWWSNRGQAYANNVGRRLDYHLATPAIAPLARTESIYKAEKFSDHAPITVEYELKM